MFEDDRPRTLAEAMAALEEGLRKWFEEKGLTSNQEVADPSTTGYMVPTTLCTWGYYGWGNATPQLVEAVFTRW